VSRDNTRQIRVITPIYAPSAVVADVGNSSFAHILAGFIFVMT
jgi:hypothetical protein